VSLSSTHPAASAAVRTERLMWIRIVLKPWWVRALVLAGVYALFDAVYDCANWLGGYHIADDPYHNVFTLAGHVAGIAIFGLLVAAFTSNSHLAYTYALAGLDPAQRSAAVDASFRGPVPTDAPIRDAAIRVAGRRLQSARLWRVLWLVVLICAHVFSPVWEFVWKTGTYDDLHPGDWISFALVLCLTVAAWYVSISAKHRLQMLRQTQAQSPFGTATSSAPGWYLDRHDGNLVRYFDGRMWTSSTHPRSH
jgi:Protein of unknown function (DUF2510)